MSSKVEWARFRDIETGKEFVVEGKCSNCFCLKIAKLISSFLLLELIQN